MGAGATLNALACACSCSALPKGSAQAFGVQRGCWGCSKAGQSESSASTALSNAMSRSLREWAGRGASAAHFGLMLGLPRIVVLLAEASYASMRPGAWLRASPACSMADHSVVEFMRPGALRCGASPACRVADHLLVGFMRPGALHCGASLACCAADHLLVGFHLGAVRCEASLADAQRTIG